MRGLLKIWDQQPLVDADLMIVPKDAYWAYVSNLDLSGLWQEAQRILNEVAPDSAPAVQGALALPDLEDQLDLPTDCVQP